MPSQQIPDSGDAWCLRLTTYDLLLPPLEQESLIQKWFCTRPLGRDEGTGGHDTRMMRSVVHIIRFPRWILYAKKLYRRG